jgi:tryptophan 2,3-dioxygenase
MASIDSRLAALAEAVERQKTEQEQPLDDLSLSLYQMETEMAAMTETDIEAMAQEVDEDGRQIWTLEEAHAFVDQWKQMKQERSPREQRRIDRALAAKNGGG